MEYLCQASKRYRKTCLWPAIQKLWREGDWNDIKGETPEEIDANSRAGYCAYRWLHDGTNTNLALEGLRKYRNKASKRCQPMIDAAIEEIKVREDER